MTDGIGLALLAVVAVGSVLQASLLVAIAVGAWRLAGRVDTLRVRIDQDVRPALDDVRRISRNLAEVSELASLQARRIDGLVSDTALRVEETRAYVQRTLLRPNGPLGEMFAVWRAVRRGVDVYRRLGGLEAGARRQRRSFGEEEEQLFI